MTNPVSDSQDGFDKDMSERFAHEMASPLAAFRMYAQTLAELMPALLAAHDRCASSDGVQSIPKDFRRVLSETPDRLLHLTEEVERIARHYRTLLALRERTPVSETSGKGPANPVDTAPATPRPEPAPASSDETGRPCALSVDLEPSPKRP